MGSADHLPVVWNVPSEWVTRFHPSREIYGSELLAPLYCHFWANLGFFANSSIRIYMDINNCISPLARRDPFDDFIAVVVSLFWKIAQRFPIDNWIFRVRSMANCLPTKKADLPLYGG